MELNELTIAKANEGLKKKEFSSTDLTKACFEQIKKTEQIKEHVRFLRFAMFFP